MQLTHLEAGTEKMSTSLSCGENKTASPNVLKKYEEMIVMAVAMLTDDFTFSGKQALHGHFFQHHDEPCLFLHGLDMFGCSKTTFDLGMLGRISNANGTAAIGADPEQEPLQRCRK